MDILECIKGRRSIRRYLDLEIPKEKIGIIIEAGAMAPSSGNLQNWRFIIVKDKETRKQLANACLQQDWMATAPVHIVICGIDEVARQFYGIRGERLYTIQNCAAAMQNMLLTAHDLELGACWVGAFDENMVRKAVSIPENARPQAIITLGIPNEIVPEPKKTDLTHLAFIEKYNNKVEDIESVMGFYGAAMQQRLQKGKEALDKTGAHLGKHGKRILEKIKEKINKR
ncbi:nitroreductase family protein [Candidatus Woesearchaeota archaeon]|nr:nitroreductase family protein [Candidatus Woesearchaeota archaeon]MBL7050913.1 nitroreductase family protein [Candidatus Woesearchaeota archaeon]